MAMRLVLLDDDITGIGLAWSACGTEDVEKCQMRLLTRGGVQCAQWLAPTSRGQSSHVASELIVASLELSRCSAS